MLRQRIRRAITDATLRQQRLSSSLAMLSFPTKLARRNAIAGPDSYEALAMTIARGNLLRDGASLYFSCHPGAAETQHPSSSAPSSSTDVPMEGSTMPKTAPSCTHTTSSSDYPPGAALAITELKREASHTIARRQITEEEDTTPAAPPLLLSQTAVMETTEEYTSPTAAPRLSAGSFPPRERRRSALVGENVDMLLTFQQQYRHGSTWRAGCIGGGH